MEYGGKTMEKSEAIAEMMYDSFHRDEDGKMVRTTHVPREEDVVLDGRYWLNLISGEVIRAF